MAKHIYKGAYNSRSLRTGSKLRRAGQPITLARLEILTTGMPCAICGALVRVPEHTLCEACAKTQEA